MRRTILLALLAALSATFTAGIRANAQQQQPGATLIGTIICADTSTPARFAHIFLKPVNLDTATVDSYVQQTAANERRMQQMVYGNANPSPSPPPPQTQAERDTLRRNATTAVEQINSTIADVTGHYTLSGIAPGTYYVHAQMPGYIDPLDTFTNQEQTSSDPDTRARIAAVIPILTIAGDEQQRTDLRLERGGAVTGRILFDDGAPATGWIVSIVPKSELTRKPGDPPPASTPNLGGIGASSPLARTDDLGNYRITGLPAGEYSVHALLFVSTPGTRNGAGAGLPISVFNGDALRLADAKFFALTPGQLRSGTDITVPLRTMHNIHGYVVAKSDGHRVNGGRVQLISTTDESAQHTGAQLSADGSFQFYSVPPGTYKLAIDNAEDIAIVPVAAGTPIRLGLVPFNPGPRTIAQSTHRYESADTTITLGDMDLTDVTITVPEIDPENPSAQ